jgi:ABC-type amino acid transport substrate-binding protein
MTGTANQIDWATQIRVQVDAEFDRVAAALRSAAGDNRAVIEILESKRADVMANDRAGYLIKEWQELRDQVRQLIVKDPRYKKLDLHER